MKDMNEMEIETNRLSWIRDNLYNIHPADDDICGVIELRPNWRFAFQSPSKMEGDWDEEGGLVCLWVD